MQQQAADFKMACILSDFTVRWELSLYRWSKWASHAGCTTLRRTPILNFNEASRLRLLIEMLRQGSGNCVRPAFHWLHISLWWRAVVLPLPVSLLVVLVGFFRGYHAHLIWTIKHLLILVNFCLPPHSVLTGLMSMDLNTVKEKSIAGGKMIKCSWTKEKRR